MLTALVLVISFQGCWAVVCDTASQKEVQCVKLAGSAGVSMPLVALGTWRGSYKDCSKNNYTCTQEKAFSSVKAWAEMHGTHVDAANDYRDQVQVGEGLRAGGYKRSEMFITTKCPGAIGYEATIQCMEDNLQMLGFYGDNKTGYVDLLLVHFPEVIKAECEGTNTSPECTPPNSPFYDPGTEARQETWRAMEKLLEVGRTRSIGISDYNSTHIMETLQVATQPIAVHQVEWHPLKHDEGMLSLCLEHGIQLQAWSPLGGASGSVLSNPAVKKIAANYNVSTAQVVLRWSIQRGVAVVTGTDNPAHMASDKAVFGFELSHAEVDAISAMQSLVEEVVEV